ncbi:MAG: hypothetical protein WKF87_13830 [Chryseolinea sp.]
MIKKSFYYITHWEIWHWFAKYIIIGPAWLWLCLRAKSLWFFTASNPSITFGGFIGESKSEIYKQLPVGTYPRSVYAEPHEDLHGIAEQLEELGLAFPLAVKPDIGMMGFMFRRIDSIEQLKQYHTAIPVRYIIQELVTYPIEVSVFYYRFPDQQKGHITGFVKKEFMEVQGDGKRTLKELISSYPRAQYRLNELFSKHESKLDNIVPKGEIYCLSYALNLSRGGRLISLATEKDDRLLALFDKISLHSKTFYYGRYDIKCSSIEELKQERNFSILEYNGSGAEPHHVYGNGYGFFEACAVLVEHWNILYKISQHNYDRGIPRWKHSDAVAFTKMARKHFKALKVIDEQFELDSYVTPMRSADYLTSSEEISNRVLINN